MTQLLKFYALKTWQSLITEQTNCKGNCHRFFKDFENT